MASPFLIYFAGVGTVVAALGIGFGGGWVLSSAEPGKESAAKPERPPITSTPVTVRTPEQNAVKPAESAVELHSTGTTSIDTPSSVARPAETDGRAAPGANWVAMPPRESTGTQSAGTAATIAPAAPITAPLDPPRMEPAAAPPSSAPPSSATVTVRRGPDAERVVVDREPSLSEPRVMDQRVIETRPVEAKSAKPKTERKLRQADQRRDQRRAERQNVAAEEVEADDDDDEPAPPPQSPPMRDAGALRGF